MKTKERTIQKSTKSTKQNNRAPISETNVDYDEVKKKLNQGNMLVAEPIRKTTKKRSIENPNQPSKAVLQHNSLATQQCLYYLLRQTRVRKLRLRQYQSRIRWSFLRELHAFP